MDRIVEIHRREDWPSGSRTKPGRRCQVEKGLDERIAELEAEIAAMKGR